MQLPTGRQRPLNHDPAAVRRARLIRGLTQAEAARRAKISASHLSLAESGKRSLGLDCLRRLSRLYRVPMKELVDRAAS
jgi:transcriptional regulator with XRE-family HTH domain